MDCVTDLFRYQHISRHYQYTFRGPHNLSLGPQSRYNLVLHGEVFVIWSSPGDRITTFSRVVCRERLGTCTPLRVRFKTTWAWNMQYFASLISSCRQIYLCSRRKRYARTVEVKEVTSNSPSLQSLGIVILACVCYVFASSCAREGYILRYGERTGRESGLARISPRAMTIMIQRGTYAR